MKKSIIYILLLGALFLFPLQGEDVGELLPVEVVHLYREGDMIVITTDTEAAGRGETVDAALDNLKATTAGIVFLDTADYLLIDEGVATDVIALKKHLKPSVRVCKAMAEVDLKEAAVYLAVHRPKLKLKEYRDDLGVQQLVIENNRMELKEK